MSALDVSHGYIRRSKVLATSMVFGVLSVTGCNFAAARYSVSVENATTLRTLRGQWINVGTFNGPESEQTAMTCRVGGQIKAPDGESLSEYVRVALMAELKMAEVYSASAPVTLTGTIDQAKSDSLSGTWELGLTILSSNHKSIHVDEKYGFASSYSADIACPQTAQALMPAVQDLITKLVRDPGFRALVSVAEPTAVTAVPEPKPETPPLEIR
jgi:hypothetical protein